MHFPAQGKLVAHLNQQLDCSFSLEVMSVVTKPLEIDVPAGMHSERFENLPEDIKVIQTGETAGFYGKSFSCTVFRDPGFG